MELENLITKCQKLSNEIDVLIDECKLKMILLTTNKQ